MERFKKLFFRRPPDGLLEISERVYVFDSCYSMDAMDEEEYQVYVSNTIKQLKEQFPDASIFVFNFKEGNRKSYLSEILGEIDKTSTVMDYPRQYEGCPLLPLEMIHHFLRSGESWMSMEGQHNVVLMHCEKSGWAVLAFMLASLLIYRKQQTGEHKTLDMIYKQAPVDLLQLVSPLNPIPSQIRYLEYISRRGNGAEWPPPVRVLTIDCIILRVIPNFDGEGGCSPIIRIFGQDPFNPGDGTPKMLYATPKTSKTVRHYRKVDCDVAKIDIHCNIQSDVVLECINMDLDSDREEMMFRIMFNTAFVRSNILMLGRDDIDIQWNRKDHFPKDFRAEVLFSDMESSSPCLNVVTVGIDEKDYFHLEEFAKARDIFHSVDLTQNKDTSLFMELNKLNSVQEKITTVPAPLHSENEQDMEKYNSFKHLSEHTSPPPARSVKTSEPKTPTRIENVGTPEKSHIILNDSPLENSCESGSPCISVCTRPDDSSTLGHPESIVTHDKAALSDSQATLSTVRRASTPPPPPPPLPVKSIPTPSPPSVKSIQPPPPPPPPPVKSVSSSLCAQPPLNNNSAAPAAPSNGRSTPSAPPPPPPPPSNNKVIPSAHSNSKGPPPPPPPPLPNSKALPVIQSNSKGLAPPPPPPPPNKKATAPPPPPPVPLGSKKLSSNRALSKESQGVPTPPAISSYPSLSAQGRGNASMSRKTTAASTQKRPLKPLHWVKVTRAMSGSLWAEAQKYDDANRGPEIDISELESLFSTGLPASDNGQGNKSGNRRASLGPKRDRVHLVDLRRSNNCEIMLTKVKMPLPDVLSAVMSLDDTILDSDQVENLIKFCPTKEEMDLLKGYTGDKENLGRCEQFFLEMMKVPRVESKLRVFLFKIQFSSQVADLRKELSIVKSASQEVRESLKLRKIMQTILSLGNALNQGTARGAAIGFKLDSLLKLTDTRARNNKMTLMHYLCKVLASKLPELLDFHKDLVHLEAASKIQLKSLAEEMQAINVGLRKVEQELSATENDGPVSEGFRTILKDFLHSAEAEVRGLTSLYSEVGQNADALARYFGEDPARCPFEQVVSTLVTFMAMFKRAHNENCKQEEFERKKAEKEGEKERMKAGKVT
eukprot:TRINITY_DN3279_c0_g2_i1.p1 TRINITY_DN3279_c0_g2~~TRINITY_DN3279_c0_g2_i1.p1  ORF type:complete len:1110 (+),score=268.25 TRINITY_DN3279_c0_g2_i1:355-3684(+)